MPATDEQRVSLGLRADEFHGYVKLGMTHLQDALPVTLGMEFRAWSGQIGAALAGAAQAASVLCELPQGGTASGSGVNGDPDFARRVAVELGAFAGVPMGASLAPSRLMAAHDGFAALCSALNVLAGALMKLCNDIRLLTSSLGGTAGMVLPDEGLSSSIMPAKRNATVCEAVIQVGHRVMGNSATVVSANAAGTLQLNTCKALILAETLGSIHLLADAQRTLVTGCVRGLQADREQLAESLERSPVLAAVLAPAIGYDAAAQLVRESTARALSMRELVANNGAMSVADYDTYLARALDADRLDRVGSQGTKPATRTNGSGGRHLIPGDTRP